MALYACRQCNCIENTACGDYYRRTLGKNKKPPLCSECSSGEWHGIFPKQSAEGMLIDEGGYLWNESNMKQSNYPGKSPLNADILGTVQRMNDIGE